MRRKLLLLFKFVLSGVLLYWLFKRGDLTLNNLTIGLSNVKLVVVVLLFKVAQLLLGSYRSALLMQFQTISFKIVKRVVSITWAASFLNCVLPSSIFGEAYRIQKLMKVDPSINKDNAVYAVIFTKIFSIMSLLFVATVPSFFVQSVSSEGRLYFYLLYCFIGISILALLFRERVIKMLKPLFLVSYRFRKGEFFKRRLNALGQYHVGLLRSNKLIVSSLLSIVIQTLNVISVVLIVMVLNEGVEIDIYKVLVSVPIGLLAQAIPISFMGLGVGHVAFDKLLRTCGVSNGADVFTVFFVLSYLYYLIGAIPMFCNAKCGDRKDD